MAREFYPEISMDPERWRPSGSKSQQRLLKVVKALFPHGTDIKYNFSLEHCYQRTNLPMQLDIYIPQYKIAFEYQGYHHFSPINVWGAYENQIRKDEEKKLKCKENNITLISVPYWWDFSIKSLAATIYKVIVIHPCSYINDIYRP
jgi:hypothetical protein